MSNQFRHYAKELLNIALPIIMGNLGFILIGAGDVLIAGRHSTDTLAAISIATAVINVIFIFGIGLLGSVSPILSNKRGAKQPAKRYFYPTIRFALIMSLITSVAVFLAIPLIDYLHFEARLVPAIKEYMFISAFATVGMYLNAALKEYLQAFEIVLFPNLVTVICVFLNLILNAVLVFGFGPIPSLGVAGLAIASLIVRWVMGLALYFYCLIRMNTRDFHDISYYRSIMQVGLPISLAVMVEFVAFNSIAIIMGRVAGIYAAAQNLVCTLTTVSFMVPLALSNAIAVKVGFANGANNLRDLKKYAFVGIVMATGFMACSSVVFATFPDFLVGLFTKDKALVSICVPVIYILSMFQVCDGLQVALAGVFKGIKKTKVVLISNFIAYWLIYLPVGYVLAFNFGLKLRGFWYGLCVSAVILCVMMVTMLKKEIRKMTIATNV